MRVGRNYCFINNIIDYYREFEFSMTFFALSKIFFGSFSQVRDHLPSVMNLFIGDDMKKMYFESVLSKKNVILYVELVK